MGFSVSATYALLFVGFLLAMGTLHASASNAVEDVRDAQRYQNDHLASVQSTDVAVTDVHVDDADACDVNVTATNTGDADLSVDATDVVVDGEYRENVPASAAVDGDGGTDLWRPGEPLEVDVGKRPAPPERVLVVAGPGVADAVEVSGLSC